MVVRKDLADCMKSTDNMEVASAMAVAEVAGVVKAFNHIRLEGLYTNSEIFQKFKEIYPVNPDIEVEYIGCFGTYSYDGNDYSQVIGLYLDSEYAFALYKGGSSEDFETSDEDQHYWSASFIIPNIKEV